MKPNENKPICDCGDPMCGTPVLKGLLDALMGGKGLPGMLVAEPMIIIDGYMLPFPKNNPNLN